MKIKPKKEEPAKTKEIEEENNKESSEPKPIKIEDPKKEEINNPPKKEEPQKLEPSKFPKFEPMKKDELPKSKNNNPRMSLPVNNLFANLRETLMRNMQSREKPSETSKGPSEPIKVIKSDAMKNMLAEMNKHFEESSSANDEPIQVIEGSGGPDVPPPPPPPPLMGPGGGNIPKIESIPEPPSIGVPPPPPPPPPPIFDPNKVPKKPKKNVVKKEAPRAPTTPSVNQGSSMKELLMKVQLKKVKK